MTELLLTMGKWTWIIEFVSLCLFVGISIQDKKVGSSVVALLIVVVLGGLMRQYAPHLYAITDPEYQAWVRFAWYMGFTAIYAFGMFILTKVHLTFMLRFSFMAKTVLFGYFVAGQLQLFRYAERAIGKTDYLQQVYQVGIPTINIGIAITALFFAVVMVISKIRIQQGKSLLLIKEKRGKCLFSNQQPQTPITRV